LVAIVIYKMTISFLTKFKLVLEPSILATLFLLPCKQSLLPLFVIIVDVSGVPKRYTPPRLSRHQQLHCHALPHHQ